MKTIHVAAANAPALEGSGKWGSAFRLADKALTGSSLSVLRMVLHAQHSGRKHRHGNADEVIYLIRGNVQVHGGDETKTFQSGDSLSIPADVIHQIENTGSDDAEMMISYSTGERSYAME
jgi:quercetin dioxygenase-like cupin family protein